MAEVGSMQIGGSINTQAIEAGLARVEAGLKEVAVAGNSVNSDFVRINQQTKKLGKNLSLIATVGSVAIIGLAKGAPAVAGAMARIEVDMGKLSRTLGESLKPAFDATAQSFSGFVGFIQENSGTIRSFTSDVIGALRLEIDLLSTVWSKISQTGIPFLDITIGEGLKKIIELGSKLSLDVFTPNVSSLIDESKSGKGLIESGGGVLRSVLPGGSLNLVTDRLTPYMTRLFDLLLGKNDRKATSLELEYTL